MIARTAYRLTFVVARAVLGAGRGRGSAGSLVRAAGSPKAGGEKGMAVGRAGRAGRAAAAVEKDRDG